MGRFTLGGARYGQATSQGISPTERYVVTLSSLEAWDMMDTEGMISHLFKKYQDPYVVATLGAQTEQTPPVSVPVGRGPDR
jgi:hypothetical protein